MKKIISVFLCAMLTLALCSCASKNDEKGYATSKNASGNAVITAGNVSAAVGDTVTVPFYVSADCRIAATDISVSFDSECLEYISSEKGEIYSDGVLTDSASDGTVKLALIILETPEQSGEMFNITFKVKAGSGKTLDIIPAIETCCESDIVTKLTPETVGGKITIK